jgi:hypothetical protein
MTGTFDVYLSVPTFTGADYYWDASSVLCQLPPSAQGIIYDIDVVQ